MNDFLTVLVACAVAAGLAVAVIVLAPFVVAGCFFAMCMEAV